MNIEALHLNNFKRFSDLKIDLSPLGTPPKLILLIGANGSGKSCIFDAFEYLSGPAKGPLRDHYLDYFKKRPDVDMSVYCTLGGGIRVQRTNIEHTSVTSGWDGRAAFYGRSSFRTVPILDAHTRSPKDLTKDADRPQRFIEQDMRFATDVSQITENILHGSMGRAIRSDTMRARFTDPINEALERIFRASSQPTCDSAS